MTDWTPAKSSSVALITSFTPEGDQAELTPTRNSGNRRPSWANPLGRGLQLSLEEVSESLSPDRTVGCNWPDEHGVVRPHPHHPSLGPYCPVCLGKFPRGLTQEQYEAAPVPDPPERWPHGRKPDWMEDAADGGRL